MRGVDHMDFSADGRYLIAQLRIFGPGDQGGRDDAQGAGTEAARDNAMPQDVRLTPDGSVFYVADMMSDGVCVIDGDAFKTIGFIPTGKGAHGLYFSRDSKYMYVSNRGEGSVSLVDAANASGRHEVEDSGRRKPGHGRRLHGRQGPLAVWPIQRRSVRPRHDGRASAGANSGRKGAARPVRVPAAGPLFARAHRQHALAARFTEPSNRRSY